MDKFSETRMIPNGESPKRKPGRPRKNPLPEEETTEEDPVRHQTGVFCPQCGSNRSYVYKTLPVTGGRRERKRLCQVCRRIWTTWEG